MKVLATVTLRNYVMKNRRKELGITQKELAEKVGIDQNNISKIELIRRPYLDNFDFDLITVLEIIAETLSIDFDKIFPQDCIDIISKNTIPKPISRILEKDIRELVSTNTPYLIENTSDLEDIVDNSILKDKLDESLSCLPEREREVLIDRFGYEDGIQKSLEEMAEKYNVTRERIRQVEAQALRRLKHPTRIRHLRSHLDDRSYYDAVKDALVRLGSPLMQCGHLADSLDEHSEPYCSTCSQIKEAYKIKELTGQTGIRYAFCINKGKAIKGDVFYSNDKDLAFDICTSIVRSNDKLPHFTYCKLLNHDTYWCGCELLETNK